MVIGNVKWHGPYRPRYMVDTEVLCTDIYIYILCMYKVGRYIDIHVHTYMYQVRVYPVHQDLGFLRTLCIALTQPDQLRCLRSSVVEDLPSKQYIAGLSPT